jgi:poly(ADP-ribose) glycohydrolase ARH3
VSQERLTESAIGAMLGCAVGDAVGELAFELRSRNDLMATAARLPVLRYTDDTAMAIAVAESLIAAEKLDGSELGDRFARHYDAEPWRGYGPGPPRIFETVATTGMSYAEAARQLYNGEGSLGNGAAMRVAPLGVTLFEDLDRLYDAACESAEITHAHPVGQDGAAIQATAVAIATAHHVAGTTLDPAATAARLTATARTDRIQAKMALVERALAEDWSPTQAADAIGRSVAVDESMPFAVYAFLRTPADSLACKETAVLNGGDRDTLGAMAMAIAGAHLGPQGLRKVLTNRLERRDHLEELGRQLAARFPVRAADAG